MSSHLIARASRIGLDLVFVDKHDVEKVPTIGVVVFAWSLEFFERSVLVLIKVKFDIGVCQKMQERQY